MLVRGTAWHCTAGFARCSNINESLLLTVTYRTGFCAACWHDLVMANGTAVHAPGVFASDYVPLWAGVAAAGGAQASSVVSSLQHSGNAACHVSMPACSLQSCSLKSGPGRPKHPWSTYVSMQTPHANLSVSI